MISLENSFQAYAIREITSILTNKTLLLKSAHHMTCHVPSRLVSCMLCLACITENGRGLAADHDRSVHDNKRSLAGRRTCRRSDGHIPADGVDSPIGIVGFSFKIPIRTQEFGTIGFLLCNISAVTWISRPQGRSVRRHAP